MAKHKGCKRSQQHKLDATIDARHHPAVKMRLAQHVTGAAPLPVSVSLIPFDPEGIDQGQSGSCTCHSTPAGLACALAAAGQPAFLGSMHCLYSDSGRIETPTGPLQDSGREIADVMACLQKGIHVFEGNSPDGRFSDIWTNADLQAAGLSGPPQNVCLDTTPAEKACELDTAFGEHTVDTSAPDFSDVCAAALAATPGAPLVVGTWVGPAFENASPSSVVGPESQATAPSGGGHAIRVVGYRTNSKGEREWNVSNSWGKSWCIDGRVWVSDAWLKNCWEVWIMNCTLKVPVTPPDPGPDSTPTLPSFRNPPVPPMPAVV
jgi:hypothetical protein